MKYYNFSLTTLFPVCFFVFVFFLSCEKKLNFMQFEKMDTGKNYIGIVERKRKKLGRIDKEGVG